MPDRAPDPPSSTPRSFERHGLQRRALVLAVVGMLVPIAVLSEISRRGFERSDARLVAERGTLARSVASALEISVSSGEALDPSVRAARAGLFLKTFRDERTLAVELLDAGGRVLAASRELPLASDDVSATAPVPSTGWTVRVRQPYDEAFSEARALRGWFLVLTPVFLAIVGFYAWGAARAVRHPLAVLTAAAERIAGGDLALPVPIPRGAVARDDETGRLARSFESMRVALAESHEELERANVVLEERVAARTAELAKLYAALKDRDARRAELVRKLLSAQEDERRRIARELHDETCQTVAALAVGLDTVRRAPTPEEASLKLEDARALASRTLDDLHRVIFDLRPSVLDDLGLVSAVRWWISRHLTPAGIAGRVEAEGLDERLPRSIEIPVFRVVQEALTNALRHAGAKTVLVQISREGGTLSVDVEDDGAGFVPEDVATPSETGQGLGLLGMRERVEILGGTLALDSSPGEGTHVSIAVPIREREASDEPH